MRVRAWIEFEPLLDGLTGLTNIINRIVDRTHALKQKTEKGFVFVGPDGMDTDEDLRHWIKLALDFNPKAKSSKKKKKNKPVSKQFLQE